MNTTLRQIRDVTDEIEHLRSEMGRLSQERAELVEELIRDGMTVAGVARELKISPQAVSNLRSRRGTNGRDA